MTPRALLSLAVLLLHLPAQPCHAENDGPGFADGVSMGGPNLLLAIRFQAPASLAVAGIEVFTGEQQGPNSVGLWSHDAASAAPGTDLGTGSWSMSTVNQWQGAALPAPLALAAGTTYWLVWGPQNGAQASVDNPSPSATVQQYRGSFNGGASWNGPFMFPNRPWKFRLHCTPPLYQANQVCASLDLDGVETSGFSPAVTAVGPGAPVTATLSGVNGMPWDVGLTTNQQLLPAAVTTAGGQLVNLDVAQFSYAFGGTFSNAFSPLTTSVTLPAGTVSLEGQMVILDPTQADAFCLSQAVQLQ